MSFVDWLRDEENSAQAASGPLASPSTRPRLRGCQCLKSELRHTHLKPLRFGFSAFTMKIAEIFSRPGRLESAGRGSPSELLPLNA